MRNCVNLCGLISLLLDFVQTEQNFKLEYESKCSVIDGNCVNATDIDRVYYDHVYKNAIPLFVRSETAKIYVDDTIYCVLSQNQKSSETAGTAQITAGGEGQKYVFIYLESYRGHELDFYISIYAKNGIRLKSLVPMAPD